MDELEHAKKIKKVVKMSTFWDDPPPVVKIHNFFFFSNESFPYTTPHPLLISHKMI